MVVRNDTIDCFTGQNHLHPIATATVTVETHASVGLNNFAILPVNEVELSNNDDLSDQLDLHGVNQNLTVSGIKDIENHDSELIQAPINSEDCGSQKLQMAIHKNLVIGDSYYNVQRMKRQYPQLGSVPAKNICL